MTYDDLVPNPDNFTPQRPIRVDDETWAAFGELVGERGRAADVKAYIEWRLRNPTADLSAIPTQQVLDFLVRVVIGAEGRRAEVTALPGTAGPQVERLKGQIRRAIERPTPPPA